MMLNLFIREGWRAPPDQHQLVFKSFNDKPSQVHDVHALTELILTTGSCSANGRQHPVALKLTANGPGCGFDAFLQFGIDVALLTDAEQQVGQFKI